MDEMFALLALITLEPHVLQLVHADDHLWDDLQILTHDEDSTRVPPAVAVVGRREDGDEPAARESLEAIHDALMGSDDQLEPVRLEE